MTISTLELPGDVDAKSWLDHRSRGQLREAADRIAALKAATDADPAILQLWNDACIAIANGWAVAGLFSQVHPEPAVIELAEAIEVEIREFNNDLHLDADVFAKLSSVPTGSLDDGTRRMLDDALREFRRGGVALEGDARGRLRELNDKETALSQAFSRNIRDGRRVARVPGAALAALPDDYRAEHQPGDDGLVEISTSYPDAHPFLTFCDDPEARRALALEYFNVGWPDNDAVLGDLLRVRDEKARLLGYPDWPSYDAEIKMIKEGDAIPAFVDDIAGKSAESGRRDLAVLLERAARDGLDQIDLAGTRYYLEAVQREQYGVDAQLTRRYFAFDKVHDGLLAVTGRLFGVSYERVETTAWHDDVTTYDVHLAGRRIGRIHLDLHPRDRKYNHAAQFDLVPGVRGRQLAEGVLVCNFPRGLMDHAQVVTLFHEFGHLLHNVLAGDHEWVRFSGVATEWDFVEAPSQMLEEWAWDPAVLATFATDDDGAPIPAELVQRMRAAADFARGFLVRTQMFYAALSYRFHKEQPADLTARMWELYDQYSLVRPIDGTHFHAGFGHLDGYSSAYYTYMWSKVIAKDLFSGFDHDDLFDPEPMARYRDRVLVPGGSKDAADLVADFLGRPYDSEAFAAWLDA